MFERVLAKFQFVKVNTYGSVKYFVWVTSGKCFWVTETSNLNIFTPFFFSDDQKTTWDSLQNFKLTLWLIYGGPFWRIELKWKMSLLSHTIVTKGFEIWDIHSNNSFMMSTDKLLYNESYWKRVLEDAIEKKSLDEKLHLIFTLVMFLQVNRSRRERL
jgi:hypothetical protein